MIIKAATPVYPIKVNQQRKVVEGILAADNIGLEAAASRNYWQLWRCPIRRGGL